MTYPPDSNDDFWDIALYNDSTRIDMDENDDGNDGEPLYESKSSSSSNTYELNIPPYGGIQLHLIPLSITDDTNKNSDTLIQVPLGAEAWYGSALLAAIFEQIEYNRTGSCDNNSNSGASTILQTFLDNYLQRGSYSIDILELGSGSVGLASLAAGLSVTGYMHQHQRHTQTELHLNHTSTFHILKCDVTLTDSDPHVLQQLEYNVHTMTLKLQNHYSNQYTIPEFRVRHLDWDNVDNEYQDIYTSDNHNGLQLVIGSELVYNVNTARSCAKMILQLLQNHPNTFIILVNNVHRDGWETIFLSTIYKTPGIHYVLEALHNCHLHHIASNLIRPGGTLNPLSDFGVCCIWQDVTV